MDNTVFSLIAQHKEEAALGEAVMQLTASPMFKQVFEDNLFTKQVNTLVAKLAYLNKSSSSYDAVLAELNAISYLKKYLHDITVRGSEATLHITEAQSYLYSEEG
jgi:hypothetical protein